MTPLPLCRWRREPIGEDRCACVSPKVISGPRGVPHSRCQACHVVDHEPAARPRERCTHLGPRTGTAPCPPCARVALRPVDIPAHACAVHGTCTLHAPSPGVACCRACPDWVGAHVRPGAGAVRHLAYFIFPYGHSWREKLRLIKDRMSLFNGRRLVAVALGPEAEPIEAVRAELEGYGCEIHGVCNDPGMREMQGYPWLLERLSGHASASDVTYYAHCKGVSSELWTTTVGEWSLAMHEALLDHWPAVRSELEWACCVGVYRRLRTMLQGSRAPWHYSGSYRWWRNRDVYSRNWRAWDNNWIGSESHPGLLFGLHESACLHGEFGSGDLGLYLPQVWDQWARSSHRLFLASHTADRESPMLVTIILTAHAQPERVHDAIRSVLDQRSDAWQLLIMDSGRIHATGAYDRYRHDARITVALTNESDEMAAHACMQGWAINEAHRRDLVRGDLVMHLCDDDLLAPDIVGRWTEVARERPEWSAWYGRARRLSVGRSGAIQEHGDLGLVGIGSSHRTLDCRVDGMQACIRRSARVDWPEARSEAWHADGVWLHRLCARALVHPVDVLVGDHRHTPESTFTGPGGISRYQPADPRQWGGA